MSARPLRVDASVTWLGRVELEGPLVVEPGAVLRLGPGCRLIGRGGADATTIAVQGTLEARGWPGLPAVLEARIIVEGGRVDLSRCVLRGGGAREALSLHGLGHRLSRVRVEEYETGVGLRDGTLAARDLVASRCGYAARVWTGGALDWTGGVIEDGECGVFVEGGRASLRDVSLRRLLCGLRVVAGEGEADGLACRDLRSEAVFACESGSVSARRVDAGGAKAVVIGPSRARGVLGPGLRGVVQASPTARLALEPAAARRERLGGARGFVVRTGRWAPLGALYRLAAAALLRAAGAWAGRRRGLAGAWVHRSWTEGGWEAGASDVDLALSWRDGAGVDEPGGAAALFAGHERLRRALPVLGELLVAEESDWAASEAAGLPRAGERRARAHLLAGRLPPPPVVLVGPEARRVGARLEAAQALLRLMGVCARPTMPLALAAREACKAFLDLERYESPAALAGAAPTRGEAAAALDARSDFWRAAQAELLDPARSHAAACTLAARATLRFGAAGAAPAPAARGRRAASSCEAVEYARRAFGDALSGAVFDTLHRSFVVVADGLAERELAEALRRWTLETAPLGGPGAAPVVLTRAGWAAWRGAACEGFPSALAEWPAPGDEAREGAGAAFPDAERRFWGEWSAPPPPMADAEAAFAQAVASLRVNWRHNLACAPRSRAEAHLLLTRLAAVGLRRAGLPVRDYDLDAALAGLRGPRPTEARALAAAAAGDWSALPGAAASLLR